MEYPVLELILKKAMLQRKILLKVAFKDAFFITIEIIGLYVPISDVYILYMMYTYCIHTVHVQ